MKVLWISNILFPEAEQLLSGAGELTSSGGWMLGAAEALIEHGEVELYVASVSSKVMNLSKLKGKKIVYYVIPYGKGNKVYNLDYCPFWKQIYDDLNPDIVHIHGTEFSHGLSYMKVCNVDNVVISIQGLLSVYYKYFYAGMTNGNILRNITIRDLLRGTIYSDRSKFISRSKYELEMLQKAKHIIGRTSWDKSHVWAVNSNCKYYFCNETLRSPFYLGTRWNYRDCVKHSIFLSQAGVPFKGLHQVLKAMPIILRHYPNAIIRVAGTDITKSDSLGDKLRLSGYGKYIRYLIKSLNLQGKVIFTGSLNGEQMKQEYLKANIFICPSAIENSPNSLGEAQILGVPCVASNVGGVIDMMCGNEKNLYRFSDVEMLARKVCDIFEFQNNPSEMVSLAFERHNPIANAKQLLQIYKNIREQL